MVAAKGKANKSQMGEKQNHKSKASEAKPKRDFGHVMQNLWICFSACALFIHHPDSVGLSPSSRSPGWSGVLPRVNYSPIGDKSTVALPELDMV